MRVAILLLMVAALGRAQEQAGSGNTVSIKGTVVDSVTHQPVRKAEVSLFDTTPAGTEGRGLRDPQFQILQITGAGGTFEMDNLQPGQYMLEVSQRDYPQAKVAHARQFLSIKAGEQLPPIIAELIPGAAVSGRVQDEDGDPLPGCSVRLLYAEPPYRDPTSQMGVEVLDSSENGEYRLSGIPEGEYILMAQCQASVFEPRPLSAGPDPAPTSAYPTQFYPAAASPELAEAVKLEPGEEKSSTDFQMKPVHVSRIHVKLAGDADGRGTKNMAWRLVPAEERAMNGLGWQQAVSINGEFEIPKVFPG
jgi:protocatechuate 3,4-dioxygenase beta subunit